MLPKLSTENLCHANGRAVAYRGCCTVGQKSVRRGGRSPCNPRSSLLASNQQQGCQWHRLHSSARTQDDRYNVPLSRSDICRKAWGESHSESLLLPRGICIRPVK